jgi:flagellar motor switch protein FliN/FliY
LTPLEEIAPLSDIQIDIQAELDRKAMTVSQILELEAGSVLWLTRSAGENLDLYIEGILFGFGEIVVIETTMGIRITDFAGEE